jgi:mRNA interferase RelE/StbE
VSYTITWSERAISIGSRFLADDQQGLAHVMDAIDRLAGDPRPGSSVPYGSEDLRRLRADRYRVLYEIDAANETIMILHLARVA